MAPKPAKGVKRNMSNAGSEDDQPQTKQPSKTKASSSKTKCLCKIGEILDGGCHGKILENDTCERHDEVRREYYAWFTNEGLVTKMKTNQIMKESFARKEG